jgi:hypothetical protein
VQPLRAAAAPATAAPHFLRAGVLQQALLLEAPSGSFNTLQVGVGR